MPRRLLVSLAVLAVFVAACGGDDAPTADDPVEVTFMAGFAPQANLPFVGVYVAEAEGYFDEAGLDVTIQHSAGEHLQLLAADEVQVTTQDAGVLLQRRVEPGLPLVSLALIGQTGQQAFAALADSGMSTPADWAGRTVGYKGTPPPDLLAILDAVDLSEDDVDLVNVGFDPRALTEGQVDVYPVFKSNEPDTIEKLGFDIVLWDAADYDVPTLGLTYVATEETIEQDPEMLRAFMSAAMRGIEFASTNPEEAIDIVLTHTGDDADRSHQMFILQTELTEMTSAVTDENGIGWQTAQQWQALADMLRSYDVLASDPVVADAFTTEFLPGN